MIFQSNVCRKRCSNITPNDRVLLSDREFEKILLSNAGQALLAAILLLAAVQ